MSVTDARQPATMIVFPPFRLDADNQQVWRDDTRLVLTPKAFTLLSYLSQRAGRLVSKRELLEAVWKGSIVGEAALKVCIAEIRKALTDKIKEPRFIETVHRRGYRFIAKVVSSPHSIVSAEETQQGATTRRFLPISTPESLALNLVGREPELSQLHSLLERAMNGERQIAFVSGEAGIGKTALIEAFLSPLLNPKSQTPNPVPLIARGQCIEHYGTGEAYLPLLDAMGRLCREASGEKLVEILRQHAPTWLLEMPGLLDKGEREQLRREVGSTSRDRMLREFVDAVSVITTTRPLVFVLEDLHWSDSSTVEVLTALAKQQEPIRLLVVGTYRPVDLVLTQHPLRKMKQELDTHRRCTELALTMLNQAAVSEYLHARLANSGGVPVPEVTHAVYQRTEGNPLFVVNLLNDLIARHALELYHGQWRFSAASRDAIRDVPVNVQQLIERQIERLDEDTQRILEGASAVGVAFSAAMAAVAIDKEVLFVEQRCEELAQQHYLLRPVGVEVLPNETFSGQYEFVHAMHQRVLYGRISPMRRIRFHQQIGRATERVYSERAPDHAAALVRHFELGREYHRAVDYAWLAARNALRRHANQEATHYLKKGIALLDVCPAFPERTEMELKLQLMLGQTQMVLHGYGDAGVEVAYSRAHQLCHQLTDSPSRFAVLAGLWGFYLARGKLPIAYDLAQEAFRLATDLTQPGSVVEAHFMLGCTLFYRGEFTAARRHLETGITLYVEQQPQFHTTRAVQHPGVACFAYLAWTLWFLGYPEEAWQRSREALTLAQELAHPFSVGFALDLMATLHQSCDEREAAKDRAHDLLALAQEQEFELWKATGTVTQGWTLVRAGQPEKGLSVITNAMGELRTIGVEIARSYYELVLADTQGRNGQITEGLKILAQTCDLIRATGERFCEAELYRLKGELTLHQASNQQRAGSREQNSETPESNSQILDPRGEAEACFFKALAIAQQQNAKILELRATVSLARLWQRQQKIDEARQRLMDVYSWFEDETFSPELQRAKALIVTLTKQPASPDVKGDSCAEIPGPPPRRAAQVRTRLR